MHRWQLRVLGASGIGILALSALFFGTPQSVTQEEIALQVSEIVPALMYVEVVESCGPSHEGTCVVARSGPGSDFPIVAALRTGMVLRTDSIVRDASGGSWYEIVYDEWLRYPERAHTCFVAASSVRAFLDTGPHEVPIGTRASTSKQIVVDRSAQRLYALEDGSTVASYPVSTGLASTPTPRGSFSIYKMTPSRYMQGPIPGISGQYFDLPGVPWNLYFTAEGAVIHGAYWHESFGRQWSNGCVNLRPQDANALYEWAELGVEVVVRD